MMDDKREEAQDRRADAQDQRQDRQDTVADRISDGADSRSDRQDQRADRSEKAQKDAHTYTLERLASLGTLVRTALVAMAILTVTNLGSNWFARGSANDAKEAAQTAQESAMRVQKEVVRIQAGRAQTAKTFCESINDNSRANRKQTALFASIIVNGAKSSKPFNDIYAKAGLPPFAVRVAQAKKLAVAVKETGTPDVNCKKVQKTIEHP